MSNHTAHTTQTTKDGSFEKKLNINNQKPPTSTKLDDTEEPMSEFLKKIAIAQSTGERWVETTPDLIKLLQPRGLGTLDGKPVEHFAYHGILVCAYGKSEAIEARMNESLNDKKHGPNEGKVLGTV